jgi:hypothetical protein
MIGGKKIMSDIQVFISYARPDVDKARRFYQVLKNAALKPWLDEEALLPPGHKYIECS